MEHSNSSAETRHSGIAGDYTLVQPEPPTTSRWSALDREIQACGFEKLGTLTFSFAPLVILSAYSDGERIFTIMGNPTNRPVEVLEYEVFTELSDDRSVTTTTMQGVSSNPHLGIYKESVGRVPPKTLLEEHVLHIQRHEEPTKGSRITSIADVVQSIDRFLAREQGIPVASGGATSTRHPNQLGISGDIGADEQAVELARVWSCHDQQTFVLNVEPYQDEPGVWGIVALDLMKHAARAYQHLDGRSKEEAYKRILAGFMAEMQNPAEPL